MNAGRACKLSFLQESLPAQGCQQGWCATCPTVPINSLHVTRSICMRAQIARRNRKPEVVMLHLAA
jgi:hypothetical protein